VNDRISNGTSSWRIEVRPDTAKLTNVVVSGFVERCKLVREGKMFVKDEAKISSGVGGVKWGVVYFGKLMFDSMSKNSALDKLRVG